MSSKRLLLLPLLFDDDSLVADVIVDAGGPLRRRAPRSAPVTRQRPAARRPSNFTHDERQTTRLWAQEAHRTSGSVDHVVRDRDASTWDFRPRCSGGPQPPVGSPPRGNFGGGPTGLGIMPGK